MQAKEFEAKYILPISNQQWLSWLLKNDEIFRNLLKAAPGDRSHISQRVWAESADLPACPRLFPARAIHKGHVIAKLRESRKGWFNLRLGAESVFLFPCSLRGLVYGFILQQEGRRNSFTFDCTVPLSDTLKPVADILRCTKISADSLEADVWQIGVQVLGAADSEGCLRLKAVGEAREILLSERAQARREAAGCAEEESEESEGEVYIFDDIMSDFEEVEEDDELGDEHEKEEEDHCNVLQPEEDVLPDDGSSRAAPGTHVVSNDGYFP